MFVVFSNLRHFDSYISATKSWPEFFINAQITSMYINSFLYSLNFFSG